MKQVLRQQVRKHLKETPKSSFAHQGDIIQQTILHSPIYGRSKHIALYLHTDDEVPTDKLIQHIFDSGRICYAPRVNGIKMDFFRVYSPEDLKSCSPNRWKIREPSADTARENPLETGLLDLIIVPGLAFDKNKGRLGRGKGYYDQFIAKTYKIFNLINKPRPYLLGVAFKEQILPKIPMENHDLFVDELIFVED